MNNAHYIALGAIGMAFFVALFCAGFFFGEAHLASLYTVLWYAIAF